MRVNFFASLRGIADAKTVEFDGAHELQAGELLEWIVERFPAMKSELFTADGELLSHVHIFVNGRDLHISPDGLQTRLLQKDTINIFPAIAGG